MTYTDNDFRLYHHGILGMKWGKKQGPPYPLDASDHSAAEKKAGWRKSLESNGGEKRQADTKATGNKGQEDNKRKGLTDGQKKALIIGAAALGTAVAVYGGVKVGEALKTIDAEALVQARNKMSDTLSVEAQMYIGDTKTSMKTGYWADHSYTHEMAPEKRLELYRDLYKQDTKNVRNVAKQTVDEIKYDVDDIKSRIKDGTNANSLKSLRDKSLASDLARTEDNYNKAVTKYEAAKRVSENAKKVYDSKHQHHWRQMETATSRAFNKSIGRHIDKVSRRK